MQWMPFFLFPPKTQIFRLLLLRTLVLLLAGCCCDPKISRWMTDFQRTEKNTVLTFSYNVGPGTASALCTCTMSSEKAAFFAKITQTFYF